MRDRSEVAKMTEKTKTVCVGRFLIDVPVEAEITLSGENIGGFAIEATEETEAGFRERIAARESAIEADGNLAGPNGPGGMVAAYDVHMPESSGRILVHGRTRSYRMDGERRIDDEWVSIDAYAHTRGVSYTLSAKFADESEARTAQALLSRLRWRDDDHIPRETGFCIWRAMFAEPLPAHKTEHVMMHMGVPGHPGLGLTFASLPGQGERGLHLLARVAEADAAASADELLRVTRLRASKRDINGLEGEEILERIRELNFTTGYGFMWEVRGVEGDPAHPYLLLQMETGTNPRAGGAPIGTTLHEDAVLSLWDRISSSIRLRPSGPAPGPGPGPTPPAPQLGAIAMAGQACPCSGWWRCNEERPGVGVHGGAVQYIRRGESMPQALPLPHQTVWQRLRGIRPGIEPARPTRWTLVDKRHRPRTQAVVALAHATPGDGAWTDGAMPAREATVGSRMRTGDPCPASGWWRCEEAHALDGARWFSRGSVLPVATFLVPKGLFGGAAGPDVIQRRSVWQFMRRAAATDAASPQDVV
jgi:hypothetical protein